MLEALIRSVMIADLRMLWVALYTRIFFSPRKGDSFSATTLKVKSEKVTRSLSHQLAWPSSNIQMFRVSVQSQGKRSACCWCYLCLIDVSLDIRWAGECSPYVPEQIISAFSHWQSIKQLFLLRAVGLRNVFKGEFAWLVDIDSRIGAAGMQVLHQAIGDERYGPEGEALTSRFQPYTVRSSGEVN